MDDSVLLYEHYISDDQWERTLAFPRGGLTYLISNGTIKFYAYEDYFYRNCLISMQLPIYIVDEYMHIDGEYDDLDELVEILDRVFPTNDLDAQLEKYVMKVDADLLYQPIGDYALRSEIPDVSEFVTTDELVEALEDYYTKDEVDTLLDDKADKDDVYTKDEADARFQPIGEYLTKASADTLYQPIGEYLTSGDTYLKGEIDDKLDDKLDASAYTPTDLSNYYTKDETSGKTEIQDALDSKLDASAYTPTDLSNYYTKQEVDGALDDKLDASAYTPTDLSNYYTKQETSSKTEIDTALARKADNDKVYTKNESDAKYQVKLVAGSNITISGNVISASGGGEPVDAYTKAESDARYQPIGNYATEQWVLNKKYITSASTVFNNYYTTANTYNKTEINQIITNLQNQISALTEALNECCSGTPIPTVEYRWVEMTGASDFVCSGYDKYAKEKKQQSTDSGATWTDVSPAEYRQGSRLIESDSADCGYVPPSTRKFSGVLVNNGQVTVACNESSTLSSGETSTTSKYKYIEIGECVSIIGEQALLSEWMTSITVPSNVRRIERMGFANCISASTITLSEGLEYIGEGAFEWCNSVRTITIPDSVQTIYDLAFYLCSNLRTVVIGTGVTYIGDSAFSMDDAGGRNNIESVTIKATTPPDIQEIPEPIGSTYTTTVFNGNYPIYVPVQSVNAYKTATKWTGYASRIQAIPS